VARNEADFEAFVVSRGPALLRFAYLLTADAHLAQDLVQEALIKAHRRWSGHAQADHPEAYVRRIMVNQHLSWRRRRAHHEVAAPVAEIVAADAMSQVGERDLVWRTLAGLPRRQRIVLVLRYYEDLPDPDIASLLGCAEGTVRSLASRAFAALRLHPHLAPQEETA
jgi:RNA polymerase sigma-70 factor (sigma-E family)